MVHFLRSAISETKTNMKVNSITCLLFSDLTSWEREGVNPLLRLLALEHEVKIEELDANRTRTFKGADARGVFWIFAHRWEQALALVKVPPGSKIFVSVLSSAPSSPLLPALFWRRLFNPPQNVHWLAHSPLSFRFLCEIRGMAQSMVTFLPLPFSGLGKKLGGGRRDRVSVGVLARYSPDANLHYALNIAHYVTQRKTPAHFYFLGAGTLEKHLRAMIEELGLQTSVTLAFPDAGALDELDLLLYPPLQNHHFLPVMLAASRGVPVVASELPGIETYIRDGHTGFVVPINDTKPMAELILRLVQDRNLRVTLGQKLESHLGASLGLENLAADYAGVLDGKMVPPRIISQAA